MPRTSPCTLRIDPATGIKGPVHSEKAAEENTYNQNFQNRFCGCGEVYNAHEEKGTMFQCLGLATEKDGGCGEDWWHPECLVGPGRRGAQDIKAEEKPEDDPSKANEKANAEVNPEGGGDSEFPSVPGFPHEDDFETFICYKCVEASPWIRQYSGTEGFLPPVYRNGANDSTKKQSVTDESTKPNEETPLPQPTSQTSTEPQNPKKRKSSPASEHTDSKKPKLFSPRSPPHESNPRTRAPYHTSLPHAPLTSFSFFLREDFRSHFCRCVSCYPALAKHPQLLEEEASYEPPLSENGEDGGGGESVGTGSLLERGEAALSNVDRVRAIGMSRFFPVTTTPLPPPD